MRLCCRVILASFRNTTHSRHFARLSKPSKMKIAVEGCCHGELDAIYASLERLERERDQKVELLLIGGDFQACSP